MRAIILALLAASTLTLAQPKPDIQLPPTVRMYAPKNLTPDKAMRLAASIKNLLNSAGGLSWDDTLHAFVIRGDTQWMDTTEALLKRFDVADPTIELTVSLIRAYNSPLPGSMGQLMAPAAQAEQKRARQDVPPDLKSAIDEMKGAFNYDHYSLWDTVVLHPTGDGGEEQGALVNDFSAYNYSISVIRASFGSALAENKTLYLQGFQFSLKMPALRARGGLNPNSDTPESHIRTDLTIQDGKKIVLGKIHLLPAGSGDLFLVLSTKVN